MKENEVLESHGVYDFDRIGRPVVMYDQRSIFTMDSAEFDRCMQERKSIPHEAPEDVLIIPDMVDSETFDI